MRELDVDTLARCAYCPRLCHHVCPPIIAEGSEAVSPNSLMTLLLLQREGARTPDGEWVEMLDHCIACGRCTEACLHEATPWQDVIEARMALRSEVGRDAHSDHERPLSPQMLWEPRAFPQIGKGNETWLLVGSLVGLDADTVQAHLSGDSVRRWRLPDRGQPRLLYRSWARGDEELWTQYVNEFSAMIKLVRPTGVAWADPHEGRAVNALLDAVSFHGARGYAPVLLGLTKSETIACVEDLTDKWGCCGAAGGYDHAAPAAAAKLANSFRRPEGTALPGMCLGHLENCGKSGYISDWDGHVLE